MSIKLVKEFINEKFTEEFDDPDRDIGLGMESKLRHYIKYLYKGGTLFMMKKWENDDDLLWIASMDDRYDLVEYLLSKGADVHREGDKAIRWSAKRNHLDIAKLLLDNGADPNGIYEPNDSSAIALATANRNTEMVKLLKKYEKKKKIHEAFTEDSDPVHDMGIGVINSIDSFDLETLAVTIYAPSSPMDVDPYYADTFKQYQKDYPLQCKTIMKLVDEHIIEFGAFFDSNQEEELKDYIKLEALDRYVYDAGPTLDGFQVVFSEIELPNCNTFKDKLHESFREESDPIRDMGIGRSKFLENMLQIL